jgi:hypothetical protein
MTTLLASLALIGDMWSILRMNGNGEDAGAARVSRGLIVSWAEWLTTPYLLTVELRFAKKRFRAHERPQRCESAAEAVIEVEAAVSLERISKIF